MLKYFDTPVFEIKSKEAENAGLRIIIKREDLNHATVTGNKWWKLKYNLAEARKRGHETLLTFGGAFSNHIYATAGAARELGFKSIGVIRGEEILPLNSTLSFAKACGMELHFISREAYKNKADETFIQQLAEKFGRCYLIPEGGSNSLAIKGCAEFAKEKLSTIDYDYLCLPVGTGGTLAGMIAGLDGKKKVIGFSVLKNGDFLHDAVRRLVPGYSEIGNLNWHIQTDFHFGGYARQTPELSQFILKMRQEHNLQLDPIYTGKMVAGVFDLVRGNHFARGSTILLIHTGGVRPD